MLDEQKIKIISMKLERVYYSMSNKSFKDKINAAKILLEAGFVENILDSSFIKNIINLLAPFVTNSKVREAIRLLQEGLSEEKKENKEKALGKPAIKRLKSNLDEYQVEIYTDGKDKIKKCFVASENGWKITDINGHYILFETEQKAIDYRQTLFDRYKKQNKIFTLLNGSEQK